MSSDLLRRVQKLLALATSPNVHEAAAAAAAAQALIERHRLQELLDEARPEPVTDGREAPLEQTKRLRKWKVVLAAGLASANGCIAYTTEIGKETAILIAGRAEDRAMIAEIWGWLVQRIEWLSATEGAGCSRDWHDAYRIGAADAVSKRLVEVEQAEVARLPAAALLRLEPARAARAAAVAAFAEERLHLKRGRGFRVDPDAFERGQIAGATMVLPSIKR